jgi:hypothetical protein
MEGENGCPYFTTEIHACEICGILIPKGGCFQEDNGKYYFDLYDDTTVQVLFRKDEIANPNTGDKLLMYIFAVLGLFTMLLIAIKYFSKNLDTYENN